MKRILLFTLTACLAVTTFAQVGDEPNRDTTKIRFGKSIIYIFNDNGNGDYTHDFGSCGADTNKPEDDMLFAFDIGTAGYFSNGKLSMPAGQELMELDYSKSRSIGFSMMLKGADIVKDRFYIAPGLGLNWNNYFFKNNVNISTSNDSTVVSTDSVKYDKFKLRSAYLQLPLVLGFRIGNLEKTPVGIQVGVVGSYKIRSLIKRKYNIDGAKYREKIKDDFNLNPFKFDAIARITIGDFGCFASYSLTPLFEKNKAVQLSPFSVGITMGSF